MRTLVAASSNWTGCVTPWLANQARWAVKWIWNNPQQHEFRTFDCRRLSRWAMRIASS